MAAMRGRRKSVDGALKRLPKRESRACSCAVYRKRYALRPKLGTFMRSPFLRAD